MRILEAFRSREPAEQRWVTLAYVLIIATMLCGLASLGLYGWREAQQGRQRDRETAESTADARYSACVNFNVEQWGDRESVLNTALVTFGLAEPGDLSAADRAVIVAAQPPDVRARYAGVETQAAINNPYRDCSPSGIEAFYEQPPTDPAVIAPPPG